MTENSHRPHLLKHLVVGLGFAVLGILAVGTATAASVSATAPIMRAPTTPAEQAVADLVGDRPASALTDLPADFAAVMGYRPVLEDGRPVNPTGECSSPIPLPDRFEPLCRSHDFGYDLLRYADRVGTPAAPWTRRALDAMLVDAMHEACTNPLCDAAAVLSDVGLTGNSWRQHWAAPHPETAGEMATSAVLRVAGVRA